MMRDFSKNNKNKGIYNLISLLDSCSFQENCVEYRYRVKQGGYYELKMGMKTILAHRFAYHWYYTVPIDEKMCVMHTCDNPSCINPKHLKLGTWADNNKDRARKGRTVCFSFFRRKLTREDVEYIKHRYAEPYKGLLKELREQFNVDANVIYKARDGLYDNWEEPLTLIERQAVNDKEKRAGMLITPK